jgi:hypothetical protein
VARGYELLYLPPYPPDLNPIEGTFVKGPPRQGVVRDPGILVESLAVAPDAINARDARGFPSTAARVFLVRQLRQGLLRLPEWR